MGVIQVALLALFAFAVQTANAQCTQCVNRVRQVVPTRTYLSSQPVAQPCSCSRSSTEDLNKLILLAKMLIEKNSEQSAKNQINAEAIIKRLIDALIYTTLQYNRCRAVLDNERSGGSNGGGSGGNGGGGSIGGGSGSGSTGGSSSSGSGGGGNGNSFIGLDLLNSNSKNNVLGLDLGGQGLIGLGIGGSGGSQGSGSSSSNGGSGGSGTSGGNGGSGGSGGSKPPLINVGLLDSDQPGNVLDVGLGGTNLVGLGIGGSSGASGSSGSSSSNGSSGSKSQDPAIGVNLLDPGSGSILDVALGGDSLLGLGIGDPN